MHLSRLHRGQSHRRWDQGISENPSSQSMTHDTYDTCFHKIFSRAHAGKTYIYFKKKIIKEKVIKTRCHICHVSHLSHESTYHKWTTHHLEPLIILNHSSSWTRDFLNTRFFLNTNNSNNTNNFLHMELLERGRTRISRISRIFVRGGALTWGTNRTNIFILHTDLTDLTDLPMLRMAHGYLFWFVI